MKRKSIKQIHVKKYCTFLIIMGFMFTLVCIINAIAVAESYRRLENATNDYIQSQQDIYQWRKTTAYLTEMTRQYVLTGNTDYAHKYVKEVYETKTGDVAVENMKKRVENLETGNINSFEVVFQLLTELQKKEMYAMKLVSCVRRQSDIPKEIAEIALTEEDEAINGVSKHEKAYNLVFNVSYIQEKSYIDRQMNVASDEFLSVFENHKNECTRVYKLAFSLFDIFFIITVFIFALIGVTLIRFVLNPLARSIRAIENDKRIPMGRTYEINYLAQIYNQVYENNSIAKLKLKAKAEQDALTGLLNRGSFDELKEYYSKTTEKIALLLVDVDYFKAVNDTYGHEAGDAALVKVAELLKECFRTNDFPVRFGGDEFAVIMTEMTPTQRGVLMRKLIYINDYLQNPTEEGEPKLSVSIGVAFSDQGFSDDLLQKADKALYKTKENGRCGYTFWIEELEEQSE